MRAIMRNQVNMTIAITTIMRPLYTVTHYTLLLIAHIHINSH